MRAGSACSGRSYCTPIQTPNDMSRTRPDLAPLPLRLVLGGSFIAHGVTKLTGGVGNTAGFFGSLGIPAPELMAWAVTLLEILGGLALIVGAFVGIVSTLLIVSQLVAMFLVHWANGFFFTNQPPGIEVNLLFIAGLLALMLGGAGAYSVDRGRSARHAGPTTT